MSIASTWRLTCHLGGRSLEGFEKDVLQDALKSARGNRAKAARLIGTTSRVFNDRVRKHGIDWRRFR
jgi:Nif-specific regulatory protein